MGSPYIELYLDWAGVKDVESHQITLLSFSSLGFDWVNTRPIPAFEKSTHSCVFIVVSKGLSPRGPFNAFLKSSNSRWWQSCHKKTASFPKSFLMFSREWDILGKKFLKLLAIPKKERTSFTVVGGARSMMALRWGVKMVTSLFKKNAR